MLTKLDYFAPRRPRKCPNCGSVKVVRILYGMPSHETFEAAERGEIALGGCCISDRDPTWRCLECGTAIYPERLRPAGPTDRQGSPRTRSETVVATGGHELKTQKCPACSRSVTQSSRYPRYLCERCASSLTSSDGRPVDFFNADMWGGVEGRYKDDGSLYESQDCFAGQLRCVASEAYFGGIVVEAVNTGCAPEHLAEIIHGLGEELVACDHDCDGVTHDRANGYLPRCLVLDSSGDGRACVVVGLNPGRCTPTERKYYRDRDCAYDSVAEFWAQEQDRIRYNKRLNQLLRGLGFDGPRLWTELAKCESAEGSPSTPPLQTLRFCSGRFLSRELEAVPSSWPLFAIGAGAYHALAFLFPGRRVIGVPHPTSSRGQFASLLDGGRVREPVANQVAESLASQEPQATWLSA